MGLVGASSPSRLAAAGPGRAPAFLRLRRPLGLAARALHLGWWLATVALLWLCLVAVPGLRSARASGGASAEAPSRAAASARGAAALPSPAAPGTPLAAGAPLAGQLLRSSLFSPALGREMPYAVYLPPGYASAGRRYPVLYMLHGIGGDYEEWTACGLSAALDELIQRGEAQPLIVVMPEGARGYWLNHDGPNGDGQRWGDYLVQDVVSHADSTYLTIARRQSRAIGGDSMGGHGALENAMNHPEVFGVVGGHSPALRRIAEALPFFSNPATFARVDPLTLARTSDGARQLRIWIDTGESDPWAARARELDAVLTSRGIAHEWRLYPGKHDRAYWRAHIREYLLYYSGALAGA